MRLQLTFASVLLTIGWTLGAPDGVDLAKPEDRTDHWSFKPLAQFKADQNIDAFIEKKLIDNGLTMSPAADRLTWIRRVYFDLIGLPPSPEQVTAFLTDTDSGGHERVVNQLLASPRYGERWAQHWLDVVRYADTHGFEVNTPRPNAWPYRDYVIAAFNNDTPFDQFIREQLAGDQFRKDAGTGFLVTAARLLPGQIGKDAASMRLARQDELGEIVINTSEAFLGLSVGCARCHNHKFDAISAKDYYSMQAFFAGVSYGDRPIQSPESEALNKQKEELKSRVREIDRAVAGLVPLARSGVERPPVNALLNVERFAPVKARKVRFTIQKTNLYEPCIDELEVFDSQGNNIALASLDVARSASGSKVEANRHQLEFINDGKFGNTHSWMCSEKTGWVILEFPTEHTIDRIAWARDRDGKYTDRLALEYVIEVTDDSENWQVVADSTDRRSVINIVNGIVDPGPGRTGNNVFENAFDGDIGTMTFTTNSGSESAPQRSLLALEEGAVHNLSRIRINDIAGNDNNGRMKQITVRVTTDPDADLTARTYSDVTHLSVKMFSGDADPLPNIVITSNTIEHLDTTHDGFYSIVFDPVPGATGIELEWVNEGKFKHWALREIEACSSSPEEPINQTGITTLDSEQQAKSKSLLQEKKNIESRLKEFSKSRTVFGGIFGKPDPVHILNRGDAEQPKEEVAPTVLSALGNLSLSKDAPEAKRRLALANWIANPKNPLTARVAVNRIWQGHFGIGIVETANDFGRIGADPSHPELLDWLATEFIHSGWSVKYLHRLIVLSDTYRQSEQIVAHANDKDTEVRLLWRFPTRRLEAEGIRDAMLAVSGRLNLKTGGPGFNLFSSRGGLSGFPPISKFKGDGLRRMIYAHKIRMEPDSVFGAFDCPDAGQSVSRRRQSTTPIQALNLFNSEFTIDESKALAKRIREDSGEKVPAQVARAYWLAYGRDPQPDELADAESVVRQHGLITLCRAIFNSNEFLFIP